MQMNETNNKVEEQASARTFSFSGNHPGLDFANTLDDRDRPEQTDLLTSYEDLVAWDRLVGFITDEQRRLLLKEARHRPAEARSVLEQGRELREAMFRIFANIARAQAPAESDLAIFNAILARTMNRACIIRNGE